MHMGLHNLRLLCSSQGQTLAQLSVTVTDPSVESNDDFTQDKLVMMRTALLSHIRQAPFVVNADNLRRYGEY